MEVFFECEEMNVCECGFMDGGAGWRRSKSAPMGDQRFLADLDRAHGVAMPRRRLVRGYSMLNLTSISDKLPAFSGLEKSTRSLREAEGLPPGRSLAGLWKKSFINDMLWRAGQPGKFTLDDRPDTYLAPTWSWASISGMV